MHRVTRNGGLSTRQYFTLVADTFDLRSKWEEAFSAAELDAVIFPPMALPALPHGASKALTPALTYMFVANLLHWPAGVVPVTLIRSEEAVGTMKYMNSVSGVVQRYDREEAGGGVHSCLTCLRCYTIDHASSGGRSFVLSERFPMIANRSFLRCQM